MITPFPPAPSRADPTTFADKADAFLGHLESPFVAEINALEANVNVKEASAVSAAAAAEASKNAAASVANAALWSASTTYSIGQSAIDPVNLLTYRAKVQSLGGASPSVNTTNWVLVTIFTPADDSVTTDKLATNALAATTQGLKKMADGFLAATTEGRAKMADLFVTTAKLDDAAVTTQKLAANAVTAAKLAREGSAGQVLTSNGAGSDPSYKALPAGGVTSFNTRTGAVTLTTADVGTATGGLALRAIGSYALCSNLTNGIAAGATIAGSNLSEIYFDTTYVNHTGTTLTGTWRNMGAGLTAGTWQGGLFVRVS